MPFSTIPVLLDTDIGSNVDDALALSYLLRQPRCELLGITTVSGEPQRRASIARAICEQAGKPDIPIHVGLDRPLGQSQLQPTAPLYDSLEAKSVIDFEPENTALAFLHEQISMHPGKIILLTIGPLTNIGRLVELDPKIPALLRGIVTMGGMWFGGAGMPASEWNIRCDPNAASLVLNSPANITLVGLDVTKQCTLGKEDCLSRLRQAGPSMTIVAKMAKQWFADKTSISFHDPLAAALVFEPSLCGSLPVEIMISQNDQASRGETKAVENMEAHINAAKSVEVERFFSHFFGVVGGKL